MMGNSSCFEVQNLTANKLLSGFDVFIGELRRREIAKSKGHNTSKMKGRRRRETREVEERVTSAARENYFKLRRRKLAGNWLEDGEWHEMMTAARAINDPMLNMLMKS